MLKSFLTVALSAGAIAFGGAAFAQSGGSGASGGTDKGMTEKGASGMTSKPAMPTKDLVGKDVVNAKGETIGEVESIEGESLIVGVGGFLGIGQREVSIGWDQVNLAGTGDDAKLQVNMTKEQLEALPEHKSEGGSGMGGSGSGSGSGMGGGQ